MPSTPVIIFDLDGTLIDSAKSILETLARVLEEAGTLPAVPLNKSLIGPPLQETLALLCETADEKIIKMHVASFQRYYDSAGYKEAAAYPGIETMLEELGQHDYVVHLATNKRLIPTQAILQHKAWTRHFRSVHTLDMQTPRLPDKSALLASLLDQHQIDPHTAIYIGDKHEDGLAATDNGLKFIGVRWGYGNFGKTPQEGWYIADSPTELLAGIQAGK